ncbi:hypothetical protein AGMMS49992_19200 [Clostridia bacterium]|nr:hypothetical protein AGMMS49992_19200 [Clostridia bacterium]
MPHRPTAIRATREDRWFSLATYALGIIFIVAYPLYFVVIASISKPENVLLGNVVFWPRDLTFDSYRLVLEESRIWIGYKNTIIYPVLGTGIILVMTVLATYPLSRKDMPMHTFFIFLYSFTMTFNGGTVPTYLIVRSLKLTDSIWAMVIPNAIATYKEHWVEDRIIKQMATC